MGTEDGARAGGGGGLCGALLGGRGGGYQQHALRQQLRRGRFAQPLAFLVAGVLIGFYGATVLQAPSPHRASSAADGPGALLSRSRDLGAASEPAASAGGAQQEQHHEQAECPPCPACPKPEATLQLPRAAQVETAGNAGGGSGPSSKELKDEWGLDTYGSVDAGAAFEAFWPFLPQNIKGNVHPRAMAWATRGSQLSVKNQPGQPIEMEDLSTCKELDVVMLGQGRCYVAVNANLQFPSFLVHRYKPDGEGGWRQVPRIEKEGSTPPIPMNRQKHEAFLLALFQNFKDLEKEATALLERVADGEKRVMVMALNEGDTDMLVNFVCSARAAAIPLDNTVVFAADQATVDTAEALGLASFTHAAFGKLPSEHAKHYGDAGFLAIMWLKIVSVWLPLRLGYDVLFQDADLVWFKSPWEVFSDPDVDGYFMDDGARSERFAPLFANSGFYYLRSNPMVQHFMQTVMFSYDMIVQYASHQTLFIQALHEHVARNGLRVRLLDFKDFAGGQVFHHQKELMGRISRREYLPYTFHMCWTQTKHDKLINLQNASLWFVAEACNGSLATVASIKLNKMSIDSCCVDPMASLAAEK